MVFFVLEDEEEFDVLEVFEGVVLLVPMVLLPVPVQEVRIIDERTKRSIGEKFVFFISILIIKVIPAYRI